MKFPVINDTMVCIRCGGTRTDWVCNDCKIKYMYSYYIYIYLSPYRGYRYIITPEGEVINGFETKVFNISKCKDFNEVMDNIYKIETFK